jgi:hypothetical protein
MPFDYDDRKRLYDTTKAELVAGQRANAEQFDRAVLTLSTAFLAISMSFLKDIVPAQQMIWPWLLYASWVIFAFTIVLTLLGMLYGQRILKALMTSAFEYYIEKNEEAYSASEQLPRRIDFINIAVGVLFSMAVALTVGFVVTNMIERERSNDPPQHERAPERIERSQPANSFPRVKPEPAPAGPSGAAPTTLPPKTDTK